MTLVRETGSTFYVDVQVENAAADGAYAKSENTQRYYAESLELDHNDWIRLQWDYSHLINKAEEDAISENPAVKSSLNLAQNITKYFRWGKEYSHIFATKDMDRCVSVAEIIEEGDELFDEGENSASYAPVLQSDLKFAAYGQKFIKNYLENLPHYIRRMNEAQLDDTMNNEKKAQYSGFLAKVTVCHVALMHGLMDVYACLSKAQHGVSKVNQLPWHYKHRVDYLCECLELACKQML